MLPHSFDCVDYADFLFFQGIYVMVINRMYVYLSIRPHKVNV
jgi:hypothetical protein